MLKKNEIIRLEISGMTNEGNGVGKHEGIAVFVPFTVIGVSDIACHGCMLQCGDGGIYYRTYLSHIHLADRVECDTLPCRFSRGLVTDSSDGSDWNMVSGTAGYED